MYLRYNDFNNIYIYIYIIYSHDRKGYHCSESLRQLPPTNLSSCWNYEWCIRSLLKKRSFCYVLPYLQTSASKRIELIVQILSVCVLIQTHTFCTTSVNYLLQSKFSGHLPKLQPSSRHWNIFLRVEFQSFLDFYSSILSLWKSYEHDKKIYTIILQLK